MMRQLLVIFILILSSIKAYSWTEEDGTVVSGYTEDVGSSMFALRNSSQSFTAPQTFTYLVTVTSSIVTSGNIKSGTFTGDGSGLTSVSDSACRTSTGTIESQIAALPSTYLTQSSAAVTYLNYSGASSQVNMNSYAINRSSALNSTGEVTGKNLIIGSANAVSGSSQYASIGAGSNNTITGAGPFDNSNGSVICGGSVNTITSGGSGAAASFIGGGTQNKITGNNSFSMGKYMHAYADNVLMMGWSDSPVIASRSNSVIVSSGCNVGVGNVNPQYPLDVWGTISASSGIVVGADGLRFNDGSVMTSTATIASVGQVNSIGVSTGTLRNDFNGIANTTYTWTAPQYMMSNVSIGSSSSTAKLDVLGIGSTYSTRISTASDGSVWTFVINPSGQVGIGTGNPRCGLEIGKCTYTPSSGFALATKDGIFTEGDIQVKVNGGSVYCGATNGILNVMSNGSGALNLNKSNSGAVNVGLGGGLVTVSSTTATGYFQPSKRTAAELKALTPTDVGQMYFNTTANFLFISTGTAQGAFAACDDRTVAP